MAATPAADLALIPLPAAVERGAGAFLVDARTRVVAGDARAAAVAGYFTDLVARTMPLRWRVEQVSGRAGIEFRLAPAAGSEPEGYRLAADARGIVVTAGDPRGLFYGAVTLWQLLTAGDPGAAVVRVPAVTIDDAPRFRWRGVMLDVARHFMPVDYVKQLIDWMALHKLNTLHWHLTDDQGWRLEIRKYPRLTSTGAWRVPAGAAGKAGPIGGFYSQEEVRDIVRYAASRHVTIVPEIEMPGHAQAAISAYPELGIDDDGRPPASHDWGVHTYLFNVEEGTFTFLENVLAEVITLFPGQFVHVGGDEAVKDRWRASPKVQARMKALGLPDEAALQGWFVARIGRYLEQHGRRLIGWDEILEGELPVDAAVMSWRGTKGAVEAAQRGHDVVLAPSPDLYMDYLESDSDNEPPGRPVIVRLEDVYAFEPLPKGLADPAAHHVLGAQVNAWTEHMRTPERVQHQLFPRAAAIAEVTWSPRASRDFGAFVQRLAPQFRRYQALGLGYSDSAFEVRAAADYDATVTHATVTLANQVKRGEIRYTLDATPPGLLATHYDGPFELALPARLRATTFVDGVAMSTPRILPIDVTERLRRTGGELRNCEHRLPLRLEDDGPVAGPRAIFDIDILNPCWIYEGADLARVTGLRAAVGQLPFNFQVGRDADAIVRGDARSAAGELEVRIDGCTGDPVALLPLAPAAARDGVTILPDAALPSHPGRHDLCLRFARPALDPMWAIRWVQLLERTP
jgi:hexosaminidase